MVVLGIDAHKRTHTVVAVDEAGRQVGVRVTTSASTAAHLDLVRWAVRFGPERRWAVEDCRHLSRRLEADLLAAGEQIVRVPPKLMAGTRKSARTYGKSDPIDALAVARAALREPGLPAARLDGPERELRLLADHRDDLVADRTRMISRLRWHLHELDPAWDPAPRALTRRKSLVAVTARLASLDGGMVARLAADLTARITALTTGINALEREIAVLARTLAPSLLAVPGVAELTAAKIVAQTADVRRFKSKDAYARHNGTAPLPVWSANHTRHRLSRTGNRQLNCAIHRIAVTQARCHPPAQAYLKTRIAAGRPRPRRCAPSSAGCPTSSTMRCWPTAHPHRSATQLDIGASHASGPARPGGAAIRAGAVAVLVQWPEPGIALLVFGNLRWGVWRQGRGRGGIAPPAWQGPP
jgi:transposase